MEQRKNNIDESKVGEQEFELLVKTFKEFGRWVGEIPAGVPHHSDLQKLLNDTLGKVEEVLLEAKKEMVKEAEEAVAMELQEGQEQTQDVLVVFQPVPELQEVIIVSPPCSLEEAVVLPVPIMGVGEMELLEAHLEELS